MEFKIGQVFEVKGNWYQFIECNGTCCNNCVFNQGLKCMYPDISMQCARFFRTDGKNGHAVLLDAIGGEYKQGDAIFRDYRCQTKPVTTDRRVYINNSDSEVGLIISIRLTENDDLNQIERKVGEVFECNGEWYQCIRSSDCPNCDLKHIGNCRFEFPCETLRRKDGEEVIFKKLEKVGEPYMMHDHSRDKDIVIQDYELYNQHACYNGHEETIYFGLCGRGWNSNNKSKESIISLEIKQNKEDMETAISNDVTTRNDATEHSNIGNNVKNLKPFDLQAAKSGKPVCTRDGRKARILCYDFKQNEEYPILVAVENKDGKECALLYSNDGISEMYKSSNNELVMLPEKKEGWTNVSKFKIYDSKEEALSHKTDDIISTVKVEWYE